MLLSACAHLRSCQQGRSVQVAPCPHPHLLLSKFNCSPSRRFVISACDLSVLPDYKTGICLVLYLLGIQVPSFVKSPTRHVYFFIVLIFFSYWSVDDPCLFWGREIGRSSWYAVQCLLLACLLILFYDVFWQQSFLILMGLNLEIFSFTVCGFCMLYKKTIPTLRSWRCCILFLQVL